MQYRSRYSALICGLLFALLGPSAAAEQKIATLPSNSTITAASVAWPVLKSKFTENPLIEKRIDELLSRMTLEEKVGQVIQPEINEVTPEDIKQYHIGSVLNGGGSTPHRNKYATLEDWVKMADGFYNASVDKTNGRAGIPIMWGTDAVHGLGNVVGATLFPHNIGLGASNNPELLKKIGWATAREIAATGLDWDFSPTVAVARDDRWGRTYESWSEDPRITKAFASEMVKGLQGEPGSKALFSNENVIATTKHFIGDGGTLNGVDRGATQGGEQHLRDIHGAGYFGGIEAGAQVVMASFSSFSGMPMHGHKYLLTDVLKNRMGFDGLVVGDWNGHMFIPGCTVIDCPESLMAGLDIYMVPDSQWKELFKNLVAQAKSGEITSARLDDAVRRILRVKIRAGLFEKGAPSTRDLAAKKILGAPEHREIARQAVRESLVLLKNKNKLLPLSPKQHVLVAGDGADNIGKQSGGWSVSWQGTGNTNADFPGGTSIYAGINKVVSEADGKTTLSVDGAFKADGSEKPDVAIVVFGEDPYAEMQGDTADLSYKPRNPVDWELLKKLRAQGIPVVSLFISGRPLWVNRELNASDAFVAAWLPGTEGQGVADVIFKNAKGGINYDMKGRLSFSWPKRPDQTPLNVGDKNYDPLFAYGYGMSYGDKNTLGDNLSEEGLKAEQVMDVLELFNRRPIGEWELEITGFQNDRLAMDSKSVKVSSLQISAVDRYVQEDARRVQWNGQGRGQVALVSDRKDFTNYVKENSALVFDIKVDATPSLPTFLRLGCGSYCASDIDFTNQLSSFVGKGWQTVTIPLHCYPKSGANFGVSQPPGDFWTQVLKPFSLTTGGSLDITFSKVSVVKGAGKNVTCPL